MTNLHYLSLPGPGDGSRILRAAGSQLAPYRSYLETAVEAAERRALTLTWRAPSAEEHRVLLQRQRERPERRPQGSRPGSPSRGAVPPRREGTWVLLEPVPGQPEEPEATFEAFLTAPEVHDRPPRHSRDRRSRATERGIAVLDTDLELQALCLERGPEPLEPTVDPREPVSAHEHEGAVLFLRPNTWPLRCQREALRSLEDTPSPRTAPLLGLVTPRTSWPPMTCPTREEEAWAFLRRDARGGLRDGTLEQRDFVLKALGTPDFAVLEGPPGSGKTTAICEIVVQLARQGSRVLLVASTHVAVDNVLQRLLAWQESGSERVVLPIRIGEEGKVDAVTSAWTLGHLSRTWGQKVRAHLRRPRQAAAEGAAARQMLLEALEETQGESALLRLLLDACNLVCGTTIGILQHPALREARRGQVPFEPFDYLVLDEASKTPLTEFLVPAALARRWVVVGDRRQLSPYVQAQDLAPNVARLLPEAQAALAVHTFLASSAVPPARQVRSLVATPTEGQAQQLCAEARARGVVAVDLDTVEGEGRCLPLLYADLVCGTPQTLQAWQHRLPGDLAAVAGPLPALPQWEAHRRALGTQPHAPLSWAQEVAWRQVRAHELRDTPGEQQRLLAQLRELVPKTLGKEYFAYRGQGPRMEGGKAQTPPEALQEELDQLRRVALPSVLELLQRGAGGLGAEEPTVLTHGLPPEALASRQVSLSFQHRMHPHIAAFPREAFYAVDGLLQDANGMAETRAWSYPRYAQRAVWLDVAPARGQARRAGPVNGPEASAVLTELEAFDRWACRAPSRDPDGTPWEVAVLTFYRAQERELRDRLARWSGQPGHHRSFRRGRVHVTLCTVDRFQGHEADLVLLSFVQSGSVGFLNSPGRINVALTRARYQLVLIGHRSWLASSRCPSALLRALGASPHYGRHLGWETP
jgi:hypothetical protein